METSRGLPRAIVEDVFSSPVHINAGGTIYTTTLNTLHKYPESKLSKLFNGTLPISVDPWSRHYFLDVNGTVFGHILDYLRHGELLLPGDFTQLPLLIKVAEYFEIQDMIYVLMNIGGEEKRENNKEIIFEHNNEKNVDQEQSTTKRPCSEVHDNHNSSSEPGKINNIALETDKINIGTCELGLVKLGMLQGGKVDFGVIESGSVKSKKFESQIVEAKDVQTEKLSVENIQTEVLHVKFSKVDALKAEEFKLNVVETEEVKAANVKMLTVDAGLTKVETLEAGSLKSEVVDMRTVNADNVKVKSLELETLKLKTLEVETMTGNVCKLSNNSGDVKLKPDNAKSDIVLVHVAGNLIFLYTSNQKLITNIPGADICDENRFDNSCFFVIYKMDEEIFYSRGKKNSHYGNTVLKLFEILLKSGYKLCSMAGIESTNEKREYVFLRQ